MRHTNSGFTLMELMMVILIIGILAGIALPAYNQNVIKSRRADAAGALVLAANAMERFYSVNNTYVGAAAGVTFPNWAPFDSSFANRSYDLAIVASDAASYTLSATPVAGTSQANDTCGTLTLTSTGARGANAAGCWL